MKPCCAGKLSFIALFKFQGLKDEIFLTDLNDTDQYKITKYNNIIVYILLIILLNLNIGQFIKLKYNKNYNLYVYSKIYKNLFESLYLRINDNDKILLIDIPLFSYMLFYLSGILLINNIWLYNTKNIEKKNIPLYIIKLQKSIIHTFVVLINSIVEANLDIDKNYFYVPYSVSYKRDI